MVLLQACAATNCPIHRTYKHFFFFRQQINRFFLFDIITEGALLEQAARASAHFSAAKQRECTP
jgi:hypothetical protein